MTATTMTATTMPAPIRITTLQYLRAAVADRLGLEPDHEGADNLNWAQELREMRLSDSRRAVSRAIETATAVIPAVRPALALADVPYELVDVPGLGVLPIGPLEPARLFDADRYAQIGATA